MPWAFLVRICVWAIVGAASVSVVAEGPESTANRIERLVRRLGDDSKPARDLAAEELLQIGMPAKAALFAGMQSDDLEIAFRCRRLWSEVRIEAGWRRVRTLMGDSPASRNLYEKMFLAAPDVWYAIAETPRAADALFEDGRGRLQERLKEKQQDDWEGALANLLYFAVRAKQEFPDKEFPRIDDLLGTGRSQQALADIEPLRGLMDVWTRLSRDDGPVFDRLLIALRERRPQAVEIAREMLRDKESPAKQRQYALLALARSDSPDDERWIDESIEDATSLDVLLTKGRVVKSQLRDVALAVRIVRAGQDPAEFGFHDLRTNEITIYSPSSLGFPGAAERNAAFEKWSAFVRSRRGDARP